MNAVGDKATGVLANDLQQIFSQQEGALTALSWELFPCIFLAQHAWDIGAVKASAAGITLPRIKANNAIWATIRRMVKGLAYTGATGTRVRKRLGLRRIWRRLRKSVARASILPRSVLASEVFAGKAVGAPQASPGPELRSPHLPQGAHR